MDLSTKEIFVYHHHSFFLIQARGKTGFQQINYCLITNFLYDKNDFFIWKIVSIPLFTDLGWLEICLARIVSYPKYVIAMYLLYK